MIDSLKLEDLLSVLLLMAFGSCNPSGRWEDVLAHESDDAITDLLEFSFHFRERTCSLAYDACCSLPCNSLLCAICSSLSATSAAD